MPRVPRAPPVAGPTSPTARAGSRTCCAAAGLGCHRERARSRTASRARITSRSTCTTATSTSRACSARSRRAACPFNVNYRYVDEELLYLFDERECARGDLPRALRADARAASARACRSSRLWLQVEDELRRAAPARRARLRGRARGARRRARRSDLSPDDLYILYTGGTTGMPKGVLWRQEDIFRAALLAAARTRAPRSRRSSSARAAARACASLPAPPFMHGAAHWVAFNMWHVGGTIVVQSHPRRLDPDDIWSTVERERVNALTIVGDAFGAAARSTSLRDARRYDLSSLRLLGSGGAILTAALKRRAARARCRACASSTRSARPRAARQAIAGQPRRTEQRRDRPLRARAEQPRAAAKTSRGRSRRAAASRAGSRAAARCRSATSGRGEDREDVPRDRRRALRGAGRPRDRSRPTARCACSAATRSRSTPAARRSSPRRSSRRSSITRRCTTRSSSARRTRAAASR